MKKTLLSMIVVFIMFLGVSCVTFSNAVVTVNKAVEYVYSWKGYEYDRVFDATMMALQTSNEVVIDSNRDSGTIHTRTFDSAGELKGNSYYLITRGKNAVYYSSSLKINLQATPAKYDSFYSESEQETKWIDKKQEELNRDALAQEILWKDYQVKFVKKISQTYSNIK